MNVTPIFPTPIASFLNFITSKERLQICDRINNISHIPHPSIHGDGFSTHYKITKFLDNKIKNRIQDALDEYNKTYGIFPARITEIWSNIQNSGSKLTQHSHPGSIVSGALYINVGEESKLYFHNPNPYVYFTEVEKQTPYTYQYKWIPVENCELVIFPSWLRHGNDNVINEIDNRIVVSFNSKGEC